MMYIKSGSARFCLVQGIQIADLAVKAAKILQTSGPHRVRPAKELTVSYEEALISPKKKTMVMIVLGRPVRGGHRRVAQQPSWKSLVRSTTSVLITLTTVSAYNTTH